MVTLYVSFVVGLICLTAGFFLGSRRATYIMAEALSLVEDSDRVMEEMRELADKLRNGDLPEDKE